MASITSSYWKVFRIIFVIFSLYLMGDAFYRWDGFRYYASFSEFIPSVALVTILWSILAVFTAILVWLIIRVFEWLCLHMKCKIRAEHLMIFLFIFLFLGVTIWISKKLVWPYVQTTLDLKKSVLLGVTLMAISLTLLFRSRAGRWMDIIQERITPLIWLFGILSVLSVPLVAFHMFEKQTDRVVSQEISRPSAVEDKSRPNIILVSFDALTSRNMSVYGYHRPTTPFISEWAKAASLFTRAEAESNYTAPTTASMMTGKRVWTHQRYHPHGTKPVKSNIENLPLLLKKNGYFNMAFIVNPIASVKALDIANSFEIAPLASEFSESESLFGWEFGIFDVLLYRLFGEKIHMHNWIIKKDFILGKLLNATYQHFLDISETEVPPEMAFNKFLKVMDEKPTEPFFVWIHLYPPHDPYLPPEPYMGMFDPSSVRRTYDDQRKGIKNSLKCPRCKQFPEEVQATVNLLRARYDEFIRYCDKEFENFISQLKVRDRLKDTVVILSSDHGESFEHNYLKHDGPFLYEQVTHIPLIIKDSNQVKGQTFHDLVEQVDIPPTILELAGIPVPPWMEGRSLVPLMRGRGFSSKPIFSMNFVNNRSRGYQITDGTIAVWEGDYKLIHYLEENKSLLFNLKYDPDELENLFDREPDVGNRLLTLIKDNLEKANEKISRGE